MTDLQAERQVVEQAIAELRLEAVRAETLGSQPVSSRQACLEMARQCDIYLGIYGTRYGWVPSGDEVSVTEMEFQEARKRGKDILVYVKDVPEREEAQVEFLRRVEDFDKGLFRRPYFTTPEQLAEWVKEDIAGLVSRRYREGEEAVETRGKLIAVPDLPPHFLPRPDDLEPLKAAVLADVDTGTTHKVGVQGMGGIGKSVLTAALARDDEVRHAFSDGVLWVTVGREPALTWRQSQLAETLGDSPRSFEDVQQGRARLSELMVDKACLLVLDDVWQAKHAEAFDALGPRCRMVITTRDAGLIMALGAAEHRLDVLSDEQTLALLAEWAGQAVETLPPEARDVARECGNLPLALAMIGATVRGKPDRWGNALHRLRSADLEKIRRQFPNYPYPDLMRAIQVSVEALASDVQARYLDFAVFPEDTPIPEAVLQTFWEPEGLDEYDTQDVIDALVDRSLARRDESGYLSLHDLQFDYVRKQTDDLLTLHDRLLSAYAPRCPDGWPTGPDDGYFFEHLAHHLTEAGRKEELRRLLFDFDWLQAKLDATDVNALIADYDFLPDDADLRLVRGALRLAAHVLAQDKTQLAGQLLGRLMTQEAPEIQALLEQARQWKGAPWLRPLTPSLTPPGGLLLRTLTGHTQGVTAVAVAPDGRHAISASWDETLKVWDLESGEELHTLQGHTGPVLDVAVTPDGHRAISASWDTTLKVWDMERWEELYTLQGHSDHVTAVALTPQGKLAISASRDTTLKVWDLESEGELYTLHGHTEVVTAVAVTPDGRHAISVSWDETLKVWDLENKEELRTLQGHTGPVLDVAVMPDGRRAISASWDKTLKVWDLESGEELLTLQGHTDMVTAVAMIPDGRHAISACGSITASPSHNALKVWDLEGGEELLILQGHTGQVTAVAVTPDGKHAISASSDNTLKVWDLEGGGELHTLQGHTEGITVVAVTPDGRRAISASSDGTLKVWDLESGEELRILQGHTEGVTAVAIAPDGRRAISASHDQTLKVWDMESGEELHTQDHTDGVTAVAMTLDGRRAISSTGGFLLLDSSKNTLKVWDLESWEELCALRGHTGSVNVIVVTPDGRCAISASWDKTLKVWDLESGGELRTLHGHTNGINSVAVTPDGQRVISAAGSLFDSTDNTLKVWDLESGEELRTLRGHTGGVHAVAVTPDGRHALSVSYDTTLKVWNLESGAIIASFNEEGALWACAVAPNGVTIVVGGASGRVHFLRLEGVE